MVELRYSGGRQPSPLPLAFIKMEFIDLAIYNHNSQSTTVVEEMIDGSD